MPETSTAQSAFGDPARTKSGIGPRQNPGGIDRDKDHGPTKFAAAAIRSAKLHLVVSKLAASFLVIASLLVMSGLGLAMLTALADVGHLAFAANSQGMNR